MNWEKEHNADHDELIRLLVEGELDGQRKYAAERSLLSCPACLAEYHAYRKFWKLVTGKQARQVQEDYLKQTDAEAYRQYTEVVERLAASTTRSTAPAAQFKDFLYHRLFSRPAFSVALLTIVMLILPYLAYRSVRLEREKVALVESNRHYQRLMEEQIPTEKMQAEMRREYERQMAMLLQPDVATFYVIAPKLHRGPEDEYPPVTFTKAAKFLVLAIRLKSDYASYAIKISDATKETSWEKRGVPREAGSLSLVIPKEFFKKDRYVVAVYGERAGDENKLIGEFLLRIRK